MFAESQNPDPGFDTISTGKLGGDIAANVVVGLLHGAAQNAAVGHTVDLCMTGRGYVGHAPGTSPPPVMAAAPMPGAPQPPPPVMAAALMPAASPVALMAGAPAPIPLSVPYVPLGPCGGERSCYRERIVVPEQ